MVGREQFGSRFQQAGLVATSLSVLCLLAGAIAVLLHTSVLVPYLLSAASHLPFSSCFPFQEPTALLGHVSYG